MLAEQEQDTAPVHMIRILPLLQHLSAFPSDQPPRSRQWP